MTVAQYIDALKQLPQEAEIVEFSHRKWSVITEKPQSVVMHRSPDDPAVVFAHVVDSQGLGCLMCDDGWPLFDAVEVP